MSWKYHHPYVVFRGEIGVFESADDLLAEIGDSSGLIFDIDCLGGSIEPALQIFETLRGRVERSEVRRCLSSAMLLALTAKRVAIHRGGKMMLHPLRVSIVGSQHQLIEAVANLEKWTARCVRSVAERTGRPAATVQSWFSGPDFWFNAEEAVVAGLADEIIETPVPDPAPVISPPSSVAADDPKVALLFELLAAIGPVHCSRARMARELNAWMSQRISEP